MISEEVNGGDIGHVHGAFHFHRVRWIFRLVYGFDDSEVTLVTSSFSLLRKPILDLFQIQWAFHWMHFTGLVPIRISVLITLWITPTLILMHRIVQEMMEDQVMISICMDVKGCETGFESVLLHPFPINLFYGYISWIIVLTRPNHPSHAILCHPFSNPPPTPSSSPTVSVSMPEFRYLLSCVPTIFRINRGRAVGPSLFSSPFEW